MQFQSTPPARGATPFCGCNSGCNNVISIHAPREGGDLRKWTTLWWIQEFQSTPPARGATRPSTTLILRTYQFQSTPPARGATGQNAQRAGAYLFQSTPPARGATAPADDFCEIEDISIHAPREGGDPGNRQISSVRVRFQSTPPARGATSYSSAVSTPYSLFQSTPPARGATNGSVLFILGIDISIHAPREGGRRMPNGYSGICLKFQSTPPARGGDEKEVQRHAFRGYFNPRPPRGGRPPEGAVGVGQILNFNPRPPRGGRLQYFKRSCVKTDISIHAPREGGDSYSSAVSTPYSLFQSTPPARGGDDPTAEVLLSS